jgi:hypothetical protein
MGISYASTRCMIGKVIQGCVCDVRVWGHEGNKEKREGKKRKYQRLRSRKEKDKKLYVGGIYGSRGGDIYVCMIQVSDA